MVAPTLRANGGTDRLSSVALAQFEQVEDVELFEILTEGAAERELVGPGVGDSSMAGSAEPIRFVVPEGATMLVGALVTPSGSRIPNASIEVWMPGDQILEAGTGVRMYESSAGVVGAIEVTDPLPGEWLIRIDLPSAYEPFVAAFTTAGGPVVADRPVKLRVAPKQTSKWQCRLCRLAVLGLAAFLAWHFSAAVLAAGAIGAAISVVVTTLGSKSGDEVRLWIQGLIDGVGNSVKKWSLELCRLLGACA